MAKGLKFLQSERIYLRPLIESDCEGPYLGWFNDEEICRGNSHHVFPYTVESARSYVRFANETKDNLILAIVLQESERHIGNVALQNVHRVNRSAEFSIVIGERDAWGKGFGQEAARLICAHGFSAMNLNRIACGTFAGNEAMQKLAGYLGMKEEGRRRQAAYKDGEFEDIIEYGVLRSEFEAQFAR
jgi:[ribosomal protein S5]-alanine N-acetyltransferase